MPKKTKRPVVFVVGTNCTDPAQEAEFNKWYDQTHIPEVCKQPGFIRAERYEIINPQPGGPKYLALYMLEDEAAWKNFQEYRKKVRSGEVPNFKPGPPFTTSWTGAFKPI